MMFPELHRITRFHAKHRLSDPARPFIAPPRFHPLRRFPGAEAQGFGSLQAPRNYEEVAKGMSTELNWGFVSNWNDFAKKQQK